MPEGVHVADLLQLLGLAHRRVVVEVNRTIVPRDGYAAHVLGPGDAIEIVHFVGGG